MASRSGRIMAFPQVGGWDSIACTVYNQHENKLDRGSRVFQPYEMPISDLMTQEVETIAPEATLQEAARRMRAAAIGALPVSAGGALVGILTERDLVTRALA